MDERRWLARRTLAFRPSPIQRLSQFAEDSKVINLAEGFPDFPAPSDVKEAARKAVQADYNQYRHVQAVCEKVADNFKAAQGVKVNPKTDITLCCGQSEAMAAAILAVVDRDDEVILLQPVYETYEACIALAEGKPVYFSLDPPDWTLDIKKLEKFVTPRTKAIIINSPHNPTGKVFNKEELESIANLCCERDILAITDEVYEHILFNEVSHISIASFPGMQCRTIVTSSISKTYSVTGWRVGWAIAPPGISSAIKNIHVKLTDSAPSPFQIAAVTALESHPEFYSSLRQGYEERCNYLCEVLLEAGFEIPSKPQGSFFLFARLPDVVKVDDAKLVEQLISSVGVAIVPGRAFFGAPESYANRYVRVAFCKGMATLRAAGNALKQMNLLRL